MLKIIADDLGLSDCINEGIIALLKSGKIDGASLMANGLAFEQAIAAIQSLAADNLTIGVHLVLVEEQPLSQAILPVNYKIFFLKYVLGLLKLSEVEKECRAQLNKIINSGIKPKFINSHQHLHLLPGITRIIVKLAKEYGVNDIRLVREPIRFGSGRLFRQGESILLRWLSALAKIKIKQAGLTNNDFFIGFINAGNLQAADLTVAQQLAKKYPNSIIEIGAHPGFANDALRVKYQKWGSYHWPEELALLNNFNHE